MHQEIGLQQKKYAVCTIEKRMIRMNITKNITENNEELKFSQ